MTENTCKYRIWSIEHGSWWAPNHRGYTPLESEAGLYTFEEAKEISDGANRHRKDNFPPCEAMVPVEE